MSPWQSLPTRNELAPPLLYSFSYTPQFYEFRLTDLTYIWLERLGHKHILLRAEDNETSIDPSEDANQYGVFMRKIQDALHGAKTGTINVAPGHKPELLTVATSTSLPGGLRPLEWFFLLSREPQSAVTQQLLFPLLKSEREREKREQLLLEHLKDKDNVLSKIFDKIDPSQLTTMFPGTAGARHGKLKTSDLIKHIKGAPRFDEKAWRVNFGNDQAIVSDAEILAESMAKFTSTPISGAWWENLGDDELASQLSKKRQTESNRKDYSPAIGKDVEMQESLDEDKSTEDEDEFQRQETPPHLKRKGEEIIKRPARYKPKSDDVAATTESDHADVSTDDEQDRRRPYVQKQEPAKKALGRIGGPKTVAARPRRESDSSTDSDDATSDITKPQQRTAAARKVPRLDSDSLSDSQHEQVTASRDLEHKKDKPADTSATKPKGVLGRIGGKRLESRKDLQPASPEPPEDDIETQSEVDADLQQRHRQSPKPLPTPKKTKKLGLIGGGKKKSQPEAAPSPENDSDDDDLDTGTSRKGPKEKLPSSSPPPIPPTRSPSPIQRRALKPDPEPEPELSAEQKANRKREELKRQLDIRSKAPVKKKRKF